MRIRIEYISDQIFQMSSVTFKVLYYLNNEIDRHSEDNVKVSKKCWEILKENSVIEIESDQKFDSFQEAIDYWCKQRLDD